MLDYLHHLKKKPKQQKPTGNLAENLSGPLMLISVNTGEIPTVLKKGDVRRMSVVGWVATNPSA